MRFRLLFIDLDDTLYPNTNGLWNAIRARMNDYMQVRLGFAPEEVRRLRRLYFETYGTTLKGLQINHQVDAADFLAYVHDLPLQDFLQPDPALRQLLLSLPQKKWVFTNADANHAGRVIRNLDLEGCFSGIIDVLALAFHCKPENQAYTRAMALAGEVDPRRCVLFDDSPRNLAPAQALGFTTVLTNAREPHPAADHVIARWQDLPAVLPELWA